MTVHRPPSPRIALEVLVSSSRSRFAVLGLLVVASSSLRAADRAQASAAARSVGPTAEPSDVARGVASSRPP